MTTSVTYVKQLLCNSCYETADEVQRKMKTPDEREGKSEIPNDCKVFSDG